MHAVSCDRPRENLARHHAATSLGERGFLRAWAHSLRALSGWVLVLYGGHQRADAWERWSMKRKALIVLMALLWMAVVGGAFIFYLESTGLARGWKG